MKSSSWWNAARVVMALEKFGQKYGRSPFGREFGRFGLPSARTVKRVFGSVPAGIRAAQMTPNRIGRYRKGQWVGSEISEVRAVAPSRSKAPPLVVLARQSELREFWVTRDPETVRRSA